MLGRLIPLLICLALGATNTWAGELEVYGGANSTTYDDASDANTLGLTLRLQYNFSNAESGWILNLNAPGISLLASELAAGYVWKSHSEFYFEAGLGAAYSLIWGPSVMLLAGIGYRVTPNFFIDFPVILTSTPALMPYLGFSF